MIVTILIGFGFVLADNLHVRHDLQETESVIAEAKSSEDEAIRNLAACQVIVSNQESELEVLRFENSKHVERISQLESENENLNLENDQSKADNEVNIDPIATIIIVITQIALFFMQKLQQVKLGFHIPLMDNNNKGQSVRLTKEELKIIIEMRRKK